MSFYTIQACGGSPASQVLCGSEGDRIARFRVRTVIHPKPSRYWSSDRIPASQVARMLGISVRTLKARTARGVYPNPKRYRHRYYRYYSKEEVEALVELTRGEGNGNG